MAKLRITRCSVENDQTKPMSGPSNVFEAVMNPADYKHEYAISYAGAEDAERQPLGDSNPTTKYNRTKPENISFALTVDGTGVVPDKNKQSVSDQITKLRNIVYKYESSEHEPNVVQISWGRGLTEFIGRMSSMSIDYTLFRPSGEALRAKIALSFVSYQTRLEEAVTSNRQSPDMSHRILVRAGDTLPLLCQRIYGDPGKYREVARWNGLDGFRVLDPGMTLLFPPMR